MAFLQNYEVKAIQERAMNAINMLQRIQEECEKDYQSRKYIREKAEMAYYNIKNIVDIANGGEDDTQAL